MPHSDPEFCAELLTMKHKIDTLEKDMIEVKTMVHAMFELWQNGIGAFKFLKFLFYVIAPLMAALYWIKEHVRL
jgi:hypothetical protein